jgi:23S rRNA pseudouridine1911/1915/1917 synthase
MEQLISRPITALEAGMRLDVFLAKQPEVGTRVRAKELIAQGRVSIEGQRAKPGAFLLAGLTVDFTAPTALPDDPFGSDATTPPLLRVLYADEWIVAIDKPAGLASHPPENKKFRGHTVASCAVAQFGPLPTVAGVDRPGIVHRLDRETSGVMVLARTETAFLGLQDQFRERLTQKEYRAITYGESRFQSDWVERQIATDPRHPDRMTVVTEGGREASTYFEVLERFRGFTYFTCKPRSGRTHQIRVHMMSVGHSLVADKVYKSRKVQHEDLPLEAPAPDRHCLHALRLSVLHPVTKAPLEFAAPLPDDFNMLLKWLRAHRPLRR